MAKATALDTSALPITGSHNGRAAVSAAENATCIAENFIADRNRFGARHERPPDHGFAQWEGGRADRRECTALPYTIRRPEWFNMISLSAPSSLVARL